jgi:hypothetical protein
MGIIRLRAGPGDSTSTGNLAGELSNSTSRADQTRNAPKDPLDKLVFGPGGRQAWPATWWPNPTRTTWELSPRGRKYQDADFIASSGWAAEMPDCQHHPGAGDLSKFGL